MLVEDDNNLGYLLGEQLRDSNLNVTHCTAGLKAMKKLENERFDLCILDIVLPDIDGIDLGKQIRSKNRNMPLIFLTSRNLKSDKLAGYEAGADDYVTKPFDAELLVVKIRAILNRCYERQEEAVSIVKMGEFGIDTLRRRFTRPGGEVRLSGTECGILRLLMANPSKAISRHEIMKEVWGKSDFFISKSLDVYIARIRKILKEHSTLRVETIHAFGYYI